MSESSSSDQRTEALDAFARRSADCTAKLTAALERTPHDGALLLAEAAALAENGAPDPFARLTSLLRHDPSWVSGHRGLAELKIEFGHEYPLAEIERALGARPNEPALWHCYLNLLAATGRHEEAANKTADLRRKVGNVPALCLLEARYAGLAGDPDRSARLLANLPPNLPDRDYQRARNALQRGKAEEALAILENTDPGKDMRLWAMLELCWRALGDPRLNWLMHGGLLVAGFDLALSANDFTSLCDCLRILHRTRIAPPSQSLRHGTQTRGSLHLREEPALAPLFASFNAALADYPAKAEGLDKRHPLHPLASREPRIASSWSVRLSEGGFHVPHLHDQGLLSSACHLVVPDAAVKGEGVLQLGLPPKDIALQLEPVASFVPKPGRLILFPSFLYHSTTPFGTGERLTAVLDAT